MNKDEAKEVVLSSDLDSIINYLINAKNDNENVFIDYKNDNGLFRLYSSDIDIDETYLRIFGLTKEEKIEYDNELNNSDNKDEVIKKYNYKIEVYFDKMRDFSTRVDVDGKSLDEVLNILKEAKRENKNIYVDYRPSNRHTSIRFYSMNVNLNQELMDILGIKIFGLKD